MSDTPTLPAPADAAPIMVSESNPLILKLRRSGQLREEDEPVLRDLCTPIRRIPADQDVVREGDSGADVHLVLVDLRNSTLDGAQAEDLLARIGITVNRNAVPFDPRPPMVTSGLRIGTAALASRGFGEKEFTEVADIIGTALAQGKAADTAALRARVSALALEVPLYEGLEDWGLLSR